MKYEGMVGREELKNEGGEWEGREGVEKGLGKGEL